MRESLMPLNFAPVPRTTPSGPSRLERFAAGDIGAFESLFREFQGQIYRWVVRIVRDRGVAEDLTVEAFWRIYSSRARFDPTGNFSAWARRIACNLAIDALKRQRPEVALLVEPSAEPAADPAVSRETREKIARAFRELPAKLRAAATLALIEEQQYEEIAAALGISVNGVKSRVFRAVRILRKKLQRMGIEP
ncbi:MAG: hypothetical protein DMF57_15915 [Acidobacteria bacterium]|nr:MAG: hypothetical protein DMF57_15915 [Acidobacteriota bacterium]